MMKDPVTISTGITYDRENIEKWIFSAKNNTCPVTKQSITGIELIPNVTLRRLIQSWCTLNASNGIERFPTPKPPVSKTQIMKLLKEAKSPDMQMKSLKTLRSIASENDANKCSIESAGAAEFLASIINNPNEVWDEEGFRSTKEEALSILYQLKLSENGLRHRVDPKRHSQTINPIVVHSQRVPWHRKVPYAEASVAACGAADEATSEKF
ncbi:hypothetical protein HAX54_012531 [Datura stramonium]|uniref:U-box domain-containing protein n=1 Tax=Datura stramonium TaxID=4076 RepID=A0ABS8RXJ8_DATST|nr:hypothetical protein [Datura stramonium]